MELATTPPPLTDIPPSNEPMTAPAVYDLIILGGIPGSGKSTQREKLVRITPGAAKVFSPDDKLMSGRRYEHTPERQAKAWAETWAEYGEWLRQIAAGTAKARTAIFDATNLDPKLRSPMVNVAKAFGVRVTMYWLETPYEVCEKRNGQRPLERRVPEAVMERMASSAVTPLMAEGFERLCLVRDGEVFERVRSA